MAEINLSTDPRKLTEIGVLPDIESEQFTINDRLLHLMSLLYQAEYQVDAEDIALLGRSHQAFGSSEPIQINTWWTATEDWTIDNMLEVGSWQIAIAIHDLNLPEDTLVTSTIEQKGIEPRLNKTIFVMGQRNPQGQIDITQEIPVLDDHGRQQYSQGKPRYELVEQTISPSEIQQFVDSLQTAVLSQTSANE